MATASDDRLPGSLDPVATAEAAPAALAQGGLVRLPPAALSWALFQGGRDPYVILVTIYIFGPYFVTSFVGDPVRGQALIASISMAYGLFVALTGPILGSAIDVVGRRKPMLFVITALSVPLMWALWWARADGQGLSVMTVSIILGVLGALFAYSEVVHNSLLTRAATTPRQAAGASGLALSLGNFFSVITLVFVLWAFALPGQVDWGFIPKTPLFGLDPAAHEPSRIVGPIAAVLLVLGAIPIFLFSPDAQGTGVGIGRAFAQGLRSLIETLKSLRGERDATIYLASRMLFTDGMTALLIFGGVYAAGVMRWGVLEMLVYGILLSVFAVVGGFIGAALDGAIGPRRAIQVEVGGAILTLFATLGMGREKILFFWTFDPAAHAPLWDGPMFRTWPEVIYLVLGFGTAICVVSHYASSRTLLTRLTPPGKTASFFGLYALSGTVTMWLGSALVQLSTSVFHSQQAGFAPIAGLLFLGFLGMFFVKGGGRLSDEAA